MNYLQQILAFDDYLLYKQKLSSGQIALWRALMSINNKSGWATWFTAANATLESLSGLSRGGINKNRNALKQLGLIDFRSNGRKATSYKVNALYTSNSTQESIQEESLTLNSTQRSTQQSNDKVTQEYTTECPKSSTLIKHKQNKNINETKTMTTTTNLFDVQNFWESNGFGSLSPKTRQDFEYWVNDFVVVGATESDAVLLILHALKTALDNSVCKYSYVNAILKDWEQKRYLTVRDVLANQTKTKADKKIIRKEKLPDWVNNPVQEETPIPKAEQEELERQIAEFIGAEND